MVGVSMKLFIGNWHGPIIRFGLLVLALWLFGFTGFMVTLGGIVGWNLMELYKNRGQLPIRLYCYRGVHVYKEGEYCSICGCNKYEEPDHITTPPPLY